MLSQDNTTTQEARSAPDTGEARTGGRPAPPARSRRAAIIGWAVTLSLTIIAPIVTYHALRDHGWSEPAALLGSSVWPVLDSVGHLAWRRRLDEFAVITMVFIVITAVVSLVGAHSTRALLVKDSAITGLFGLLCLVTLLAPRPLMFYLGRKFGTDGTAESTAWWNGLWQYADFRRSVITMTVVWGVAYCLEAAVRVALAYILNTDTMVALSPALVFGVLGALAVWTGWYGKRSRRKAEERVAVARAAART